MTVQQFPRAPFLDSPEQTAYSGAPGDTMQKVRTKMEIFAVLGHSPSALAQMAGWLLSGYFLSEPPLPPAGEGQDVALVPLFSFGLGWCQPRG